MHLFNHTGEAKYSLVALMNFVDFTVFNSTGAEFTNINAGGVDVTAGASVTATLTGTELLVVCALDGAAVIQNGATAAEKAAIATLIAQGTALEDDIAELQRATDSGIQLHVDAANAAINNRGF